MFSVGACGCASSIRGASAEAARGGTPAAAESALDKLEDVRTQERIAAVMRAPEMQGAMRELGAGLSQGVVERLSSDEMNARIDELVSRFTRAVVTSVEAEALSDTNKAELERFASAVTATVLRATSTEFPHSVGPALHRAIVDELGPALRESMHNDLGPGVVALLHSPELKAALGETAHDVAKHAVLGSNEGLAELAEKTRHNEGGSPLGVFGEFFGKRTWLLAVLVTALVFGVPLVWLWRERRADRRYRDEAVRRNARAAALLDAMEASGEDASSRRILEMLREQLVAEPAVAPTHEPPTPSHPRPRPA
ncbi:hypothetical protein AKJ09_05709 [Labilithrix luteola]|uniref:Uncharacterized protein n=1 Tax=Labilithrix luteola TaxID=1391654 RepID=A0A0K1PZT4_9BACT|nr:hypothetical protein [Labilithrix luteola]AKU99045.1 hypothetical protein AKJ09_05709 [Labilithrix luteola]